MAEWADLAEGETERKRLLFSEKFACPVSGFTISEIEPLFAEAGLALRSKHWFAPGFSEKVLVLAEKRVP